MKRQGTFSGTPSTTSMQFVFTGLGADGDLLVEQTTSFHSPPVMEKQRSKTGPEDDVGASCTRGIRQVTP